MEQHTGRLKMHKITKDHFVPTIGNEYTKTQCEQPVPLVEHVLDGGETERLDRDEWYNLKHEYYSVMFRANINIQGG
jgi:hypothetical protein